MLNISNVFLSNFKNVDETVNYFPVWHRSINFSSDFHSISAWKSGFAKFASFFLPEKREEMEEKKEI